MIETVFRQYLARGGAFIVFQLLKLSLNITVYIKSTLTWAGIGVASPLLLIFPLTFFSSVLWTGVCTSLTRGLKASSTLHSDHSPKSLHPPSASLTSHCILHQLHGIMFIDTTILRHNQTIPIIYKSVEV